MRIKAVMMLCLASLLWGSGWIFGPELAEVAQPLMASALAMALAAVLLGLTALGLRAAGLGGPRDPTTARPSLMLGLIMLAAPALLSLIAGAHGVGGWPLLLYALLPLLTACAGDRWFLLITPMTLAAGAVFLLVDSTITLELRTMAWALLVLSAVAFQASALRYAAVRLHGRGWAALTASTAIQAALAAVLLTLCSFAFDSSPRMAPWAQWGFPAILSLLYLGIAPAVAYVLLYRLLSRGPLQPEQVAAGQWLQTLFAVAESALLAHARVPLLDWLGGAALLACFVYVVAPRADEGSPSIVFPDTSRENHLL